VFYSYRISARGLGGGGGAIMYLVCYGRLTTIAVGGGYKAPNKKEKIVG
jgi:hypothetical protein